MNDKKTSDSKPRFTINDVLALVEKNFSTPIKDFEQLREGHISQAFSFVDIDNRKYVIRINKTATDFEKDEYAYKKFNSNSLPIPKIMEIGSFNQGYFYCISVFVNGLPSDKLNHSSMNHSLESQLKTFSALFKSDISTTNGWGRINIETGNGEYSNFKEPLLEKINGINKQHLKNSIESLGLNGDLIDKFYNQFYANLKATSEPTRRLTHGDLGFDNVLIDNDKVAAIIDWGAVGYSDWVFDLARCDFWWPNRYGDIKEFAYNFELDDINIDQRISLAWAYNAIIAVEFAFSENSETVKTWIRDNISARIRN